MTPEDSPMRRADGPLDNIGDSVFIQNLLDGSDEVIYFKDLLSRFLRVSLGCARLHGRTQEEMIGLTDHDLFAPEHAEAARLDEQRIIETGVPIVNQEERERWYDRGDSWVASSKFPLRQADGTIVGTFGISRNITRRVMAEEERRVAGLQLRAALDSSTDQIAKYDTELRYQYLNPAGEEGHGISSAEIIGRTDRERGMADEILVRWESALRRVIDTGEDGELEFSTAGPDGTRWFNTRLGPDLDGAGNVVGVLASTRDVTDQKAGERALAHQATHDPLTGLANRALVMERLESALARMERVDGLVAVFFVDIDRFKDINDTYGHSVGDAVLQEVGRRLGVVARRDDMVARLSGDEFVVICERIPQSDVVRNLAERMVQILSVAYDDGTRRIALSASVGVAIARGPRAVPSDLLTRADAAMYRAKHGGRNSFRVSDADSDLLPEAVELETALENNEFFLVYQPLLSLADRQVVGFEALLRWDHPERGAVAPDQFLVTAERTGVINQLGAWVLDAACSQVAKWAVEAGQWSPGLFVSVNVALGQLTAPDFPDVVNATLERHGVAPNRLRLEIGERTLVDSAVVIAPVLRRLAASGVELAVDNFGASIAAIARLPRLPVRVVKLDRFTDVERQREVVAAVVATAHALGMTIVAGGIEDGGQLAEFSSMSFDGGQGHLLGAPMDAAAVSRLIAGRG